MFIARDGPNSASFGGAELKWTGIHQGIFRSSERRWVLCKIPVYTTRFLESRETATELCLNSSVEATVNNLPNSASQKARRYGIDQLPPHLP